MIIIPSSEFEADLEDNLSDNKSENKDCEFNSDHVNHRSESVFDKSTYEEMLMNILFGGKRKKTWGKRRAER